MASKHLALFPSSSGIPWFGFTMWNMGTPVRGGDVVCFWNNNTTTPDNSKMWFAAVNTGVTAPGYSTNAFSTVSTYKVCGVIYSVTNSSGREIANGSMATVIWAGLATNINASVVAGGGSFLRLANANTGKAETNQTNTTGTHFDGRFFGVADAAGGGAGGTRNLRGTIFPWRL